MPIESISNENNRIWGLWKITESETELMSKSKRTENEMQRVSNEQKRLESLAGRMLTKTLLKEWNLEFNGLIKDEYGKPSLTDYPFHISLSHSFPYVAVIIDRIGEVGIDLEQPKTKLLRIATRVLSESEVADAGNDIIKHCIYWCAKEAMIKIYGKKDLTLRENLHVSPFIARTEGHIVGKLIVIDKQRLIPLHYRVFKDFVLVFNKQTDF